MNLVLKILCIATSQEDMRDVLPVEHCTSSIPMPSPPPPNYNLYASTVVSGNSNWKFYHNSVKWYNRHPTALVRMKWQEGWMTQMLNTWCCLNMKHMHITRKTNWIIIKTLKWYMTTITHVVYVIYAMNNGKTNCLIVDTIIRQVHWFPNSSIRTPYYANNNLKPLWGPPTVQQALSNRRSNTWAPTPIG
jgi:hypothetical protein